MTESAFQGLRVLVLLVAGIYLYPTLIGFGWSAFITPITGVVAPGFWHLLGLLGTLRLITGQWRSGRQAEPINDHQDEPGAVLDEASRLSKAASMIAKLEHDLIWDLGLLLGIGVVLWLLA